MKYIKKISISFGWLLVFLFTLTFFITVISYFNIISDKVTIFFKMIVPIIPLFVSGVIIGKKSTKKGWIEGLKIGIIFSIISIIFSILIFKSNFKFNTLLFYIIITTSSILGSMIGINKRKS